MNDAKPGSNISTANFIRINTLHKKRHNWEKQSLMKVKIRNDLHQLIKNRKEIVCHGTYVTVQKCYMSHYVINKVGCDLMIKFLI